MLRGLRLKLHVTTFATFLVVSTFPIAANAQTATQKKPWEWTLEERITARSDPTLAKERVAASRNNDHESHALNAETTRLPADVVSGRENPELFLPSELMSFLLSTLTESSSRDTLSRLNPSLEAFGWKPSSFWQDLKGASTDYLKLTNDTVSMARSKKLSSQMCSARIASLNAMRRKYSRFDEFLYTTVAPDQTLVSADLRSAEWLAWMDGGCK